MVFLTICAVSAISSFGEIINEQHSKVKRKCRTEEKSEYSLVGLQPEAASITSGFFLRAGDTRSELILPVLLPSVPGAFLGGLLDIPAGLFERILPVSLILMAVPAIRLCGRCAQVSASNKPGHLSCRRRSEFPAGDRDGNQPPPYLAPGVHQTAGLVDLYRIRR